MICSEKRNRRLARDVSALTARPSGIVVVLGVVAMLIATGAVAQEVVAPVDPAVLAAEAERITTIERISRPTLAIFDSNGQGGGSGVLISSDGFALTNFHVTAPCGPAMKVGLSDGRLLDAVLVGLDPGGDVALIKVLGHDDLPAAEMGDSDVVRVGDWAFVVGNPFLLAEDFKPTVTYGIVSGVHRYQYPAGTLLEYADCIQTDAAINPGNSGGPLFNAQGQLIGINGRGSFEKRGRVNVGVGYAISINQIKKFLGQLHSGRIVDHASFGATVSSDGEGRVVIDEVLDGSDAYRRGLRYNDEIVRFGGRDIDTVNEFKNTLGTFPSGWRVPVTYRRDGTQYECLVRLSDFHREGELAALLESGGELPEEDPQPRPDGDKPQERDSERSKEKPEPRRVRRSRPKAELPEKIRGVHEEAPGYANRWFNRSHLQRVWNAYVARGDFAGVSAKWRILAKDGAGEEVRIGFDPGHGSIVMPAGQSETEFTASLIEATAPPGSGGLLTSLHLWQRLAMAGPQRFGEVRYFGALPRQGDSVELDCLIGIHGGVETRFYFSPASGDLVGIDMQSSEEVDPCEIYFDDFREVDGRWLPHRWKIRFGDEEFADLTIESYDLAAKEPSDAVAEPGGEE